MKTKKIGKHIELVGFTDEMKKVLNKELKPFKGKLINDMREGKPKKDKRKFSSYQIRKIFGEI
jgi:hypothetical protein